MPIPIDYSALVDPVTQAEVATYKRLATDSRSSRSSTRAPRTPMGRGLRLVGAVVLAILVLTLVATGFLRVSTAMASGNAADLLLGIVIWGLVAALVAVAVYRGGQPERSRWVRQLRLSRFASANGMSFADEVEEPDHSGSLFQRGTGGVAHEVLRTLVGPPLEVGNYRYTVGSGRSRRDAEQGYLSFRLPSARDDEERDLPPLSPELLAPLDAGTGALTSETLGGTLYVYAPAPFALGSPEVWSRLFRIAEARGFSPAARTARYPDERPGDRPAGATAPGRRSARRTPWLALILLGVLVIVPILIVLVAVLVSALATG